MANAPEFTFSPVLGMASVGPQEPSNNRATVDSRSSGAVLIEGAVKGTKITSARVTVANIPFSFSNPVNETIIPMYCDFKVGPNFVDGSSRYYRVGNIEIPQGSPYGFQRILTFQDLVIPDGRELTVVFSAFGGGNTTQLTTERLDIVVCGGNF